MRCRSYRVFNPLFTIGLLLIAMALAVAAQQGSRDLRKTALKSSTPSDEIVRLDINNDGKPDSWSFPDPDGTIARVIKRLGQPVQRVLGHLDILRQHHLARPDPAGEQREPARAVPCLFDAAGDRRREGREVGGEPSRSVNRP